MIYARFDLMKGKQPNPQNDSEFFACRIPEAPLVGDTISLLGNPYRIISRGWAIDETRTHKRWKECKQYIYYTVEKMF